MKKIIMVTALLGITLTANVLAGSEDSYDRTTDGKKIAWMDLGKQAVKKQLHDPSSAKFRNVYFNKGSDGIPMTCGEVNSKNSFGGYGGYQKFVSAGKPELTFLEEQVTDFSTIWIRLCK